MIYSLEEMRQFIEPIITDAVHSMTSLDKTITDTTDAIIRIIKEDRKAHAKNPDT